jgi:anti-sigma factor RsiW
MTDAHDSALDPAMLSAYLDDELDASERAAVEAQLAESPEWRAELEDVRVARAAVRGLPRREAPEGFWEAVRAGVEASGNDVDGLEPPATAPIDLDARRARRRRTWLMGAAAAIVALVAAVVIVPGRNQVTPNVTAVIAQHGAQSSDSGDPISTLAPVGPFAGFRR